MNHNVAIVIDNSPVHGLGLFVAEDVPAGADVVTVVKGSFQTAEGRYVNHSFNSNCAVRVNEHNEVIVYAKNTMRAGDEILVCYEDFLAAYDFAPSVCNMVRFYNLEDIPKDILRKYPDAYPPALL